MPTTMTAPYRVRFSPIDREGQIRPDPWETEYSLDDHSKREIFPSQDSDYHKCWPKSIGQGVPENEAA